MTVKILVEQIKFCIYMQALTFPVFLNDLLTFFMFESLSSNSIFCLCLGGSCVST